jgi:CheY-like chemotaxis protein
MKRILVVDDAPELPESLRAARRGYRRVWLWPLRAAVTLCSQTSRRNGVIADMQTSGMDGATLLAHVHDSYPARIPSRIDSSASFAMSTSLVSAYLLLVPVGPPGRRRAHLRMA